MRANSTRRSVIILVQGIFFATIALALLPTGAMGQNRIFCRPLPPTPSGLVAVIANDPTQPLDLEPFFNPNISGIAMQIHWSDIEPVEGKPDWTRLDELFIAAELSGKWVQLLVFPGFFSPAWALKGAQTDQFIIQYGPGNGNTATLPMPWDPVYLSNWSAFVKRLSDRYGNCPAFRVIAVAGPTSVSDEFTLPESPASPDELTQWLADGYTNAKYVAAWLQMSKVYVADFPNQFISLSLGGGLPINDQGQIDYNQELVTRDLVVNTVDGILGPQFTLQDSNLDGNPSTATDPATTFVISYNGNAVTGFQLRTACVTAPANMGAPGNPPLALKLSVENGTQLNTNGEQINYLEIYSPDVDSTEMQPTLKWAASLFPPPEPLGWGL
jgi:hypothetical protein